MKKFVFAFGIPVLAVASLIGSGYATWYFNNTVNRDSEGITVKTTEKTVVGAKFQKGGADIKLVLDQTDKTGETDDGMPHDRMGVHFEGAFSESLIADDGDEATTDDKFVNGTFYKITTTITIPSEVATYVNFTFDGNTSSTTNLTLTKEYTFEVKDDTTTTSGEFFKISHDTGNTNDVTVTYAQEPSKSAKYDAMKDAVSGKTIDISFEAEFVKLVK